MTMRFIFMIMKTLGGRKNYLQMMIKLEDNKHNYILSICSSSHFHFKKPHQITKVSYFKYSTIL